MNHYVCLFSVVIPTYNRAHVLSRAIDSVVAQTYPHWELLIVDDGSTDGTEELVAEYIKSEPRIKFLKRPDNRLRGGNACRNIGAEKSSGDYVTYLDSDDYYLENRLFACVEYIKRTSADCIVSGRCLDDNGTVTVGKSRDFLPMETCFDYLLSPETLTATSTYVVNRNVLKEVIWEEDLLRNQDWDFFIRVGKKFKWQYFENFDMVVVRARGYRKYMDIPSCIKVYVQHRNEISNLEDANRYLRVMMEYCSKYYKNIKYASSYFDLLIDNNYQPTIRDKFQIKFPYLFYFLYRCKKLVFKVK
jgi:glycosyltransferase involved in cell wall biosynthesis